MLHLSTLARRVAVSVAALVLGTAGAAHSETIVSSLNNTSSFVNFGINGWAASPFTTDGQSWTLASVTVILELGASNSSTANVRFFADNAGRPGATLADLGTRTVTGSSTAYAFSNTGPVTLTASNTYWVGVGNVGTNGGLNVALSQQGGSFTNIGVSGATMSHSIASGAGVGVNAPTNWSANTPGIALLFAVEGTRQTAGNEPTLALSLIGTNYYLSWPTNFTGYTVQTTTNLLSGTWATLTNAPVIIGNQYTQAVDPTSGGLLFYRLRRP